MASRVRLPKSRTMVVTASFWKRLVGFIIDLLVLELFLFAPFSTYISSLGDGLFAAASKGVLPEGFWFVLFSISLVALLYFSLLEYYVGASIGMHLLGLQVAGPRPFWACVVRNAFIIPFFPFTILWFIEPVTLLWKQHRLSEIWTRSSTVEVVLI